MSYVLGRFGVVQVWCNLGHLFELRSSRAEGNIFLWSFVCQKYCCESIAMKLCT